MLLKVYPENPAPRHIKLILETLKNGGLIIYPTDTVYAIGCDISNGAALDKFFKVSGKNNKDDLSLIFNDFSLVDDYILPIEKEVFKVMKKTLPGPYTYILNANGKISRIFQSNKKTVGIRIPENQIPVSIVAELGSPLITSSLHHEDEILDYITDPVRIYDHYKEKVDLVIDGGPGDNEASTIVDCTKNPMEILREGKGKFLSIA